MSEAADMQDVQISPGVKLKLLTGDTFISASSGIFQVNMLATEARKLGQALVAAADRMETRAVVRAGAAGG